MQKKPANHGKPWTTKEKQTLRQLARGNTPTRVIGLKMDRSEGSVYAEASKLGVSLRPANQSPYG